jgi:rhamnogalacturonyl hydrolase YesR
MSKMSDILDQTYSWSKVQGFRGFDKHDGLNSILLIRLLDWGRWPRVLAIQAIMRFPFNLRPILLTPKTYNPKGLSLFISGLLDRYEYEGDDKYLKEAKQLLSLLITIKSPGQWSGICWGYDYPWQDLNFFAPKGSPNAIVTSFVCEAFLRAYQVTGNREYLDIVNDSAYFLTNDLPRLWDSCDELCLSYIPGENKMRVMDVSILVGTVLAQLEKATGNTLYSETAYRLINFVVKRQTAEGAWFYTDPPEQSPIKHDNYHTGFILDALDRYMLATGNRQYEEEYNKGLDFYATNLFNIDGSPRWMSDQDYPHDIHGAAQGILTFSRHQEKYPGLAKKIYRWTITNMYSPEGRFYYQKTQYFTKKFTLLRWCNAWSFRALSALELAVNVDAARLKR